MMNAFSALIQTMSRSRSNNTRSNTNTVCQWHRHLIWTLGIVLFASCCVGSGVEEQGLGNRFDESKSFDDVGVLVSDESDMGRYFDGIGGISAGASSKLLVNYPEEQRNQILDYLFKPNFGASLQMLKVEIGGDTQSTDGTEASHMHESWDENYERGYEWWLMVEAKKRNPDIKLYSLPWGFPGWIGHGNLEGPYVNVTMTADYIVRWINGAKTHYNLKMDYIGIWNERAYNVKYIKTLRSLLDQQGFQNVLIVAADGNWNIVKDIMKDANLASSIHAIGVHYPGTKSTAEAVKTEKPLWSSEDYSTYNDEVGGGCWARILNQNYVNGLMTSTITWGLIGSYYFGLPYYSDGLMTAAQPWSGHYEVKTPIWITAHTTQFTSIGWRYLAHGSGVGLLPKGGSYVTLASPGLDQLTIVLETMTHDHSKCIRPFLPKYSVEPQNVTLTLQGSFANISEMNVWYSKLGFEGAPTIMFQKKDPIKFSNGQAQLSLGLDEAITLTTLTTGTKGTFPKSPASKPFPLPYLDNFDDTPLNQEPFNLAQQMGSFEIQSNGTNGFIRQQVVQAPIYWCASSSYMNKTISLVGDSMWSDLFIEIDYQVPPKNATSGVFVAARVDSGGCMATATGGIFFYVLNSTFVVATNLGRTQVITNGTVDVKPGWNKLSLLVQKQEAAAAFNEKGMFAVPIPDTRAYGWAAIGTDNYGLADFDNLHIAEKQEGHEKVKSYFKKAESHSLYFVPDAEV